jgi:hypothetical protein
MTYEFKYLGEFKNNLEYESGDKEGAFNEKKNQVENIVPVYLQVVTLLSHTLETKTKIYIKNVSKHATAFLNLIRETKNFNRFEVIILSSLNCVKCCYSRHCCRAGVARN